VGLSGTVLGGRLRVRFMPPRRAHASHILVDSKAEALQIREKCTSLKAFQKMARKKSSCPSKGNNGDLGWFRNGQMVRPFDTAVWSMPVGEVSDPVRTEFGWHLIWVHEKDEP